MLTMAVGDELNVVCFDGSSAANSYLGHQTARISSSGGGFVETKLKNVGRIGGH
jgi:hypothetical protein